MTPVRVQPKHRTGPTRTIWNAPITPRENLLAALKDGLCLYLPNLKDALTINPRIIPDNRARGGVMDSTERFVPNPEGELDAFGIPWVFDAAARGSMVKHGVPFLLNDIEDWKDVIVFPDPKSWDWEAQAELSRNYASDQLLLRKTMIYTGFFERLISFMGFENAAITMIDEEAEDDVHKLFDRLADLYIDYIDLCKKYFDLDMVELHDDWGSQQGPILSYETIETMIVPHIKRISDHVHEIGMFFEFHSCGKTEKLVPLIIKAGADMWMGQEINDKKMLFDTYGDQLIIEVEVPELGEDATEEEVEDAARKFADDFIVKGKPVALSIYSAPRPNPPELVDELYVISRKTYSA